MDEVLNVDYVKRDSDNNLDAIEVEMLAVGQPINCPVEHKFIGGLYIRTIFMPKDFFCTSLIHNTNHPYFIMKGDVSVMSEVGGIERVVAPYIGETKKGTRRFLKVNEDTIWATVHKTEVVPLDDSEKEILLAVDKVADEILERHENVYLSQEIRNNKLFTHSLID